MSVEAQTFVRQAVKDAALTGRSWLYAVETRRQAQETESRVYDAFVRAVRLLKEFGYTPDDVEAEETVLHSISGTTDNDLKLVAAFLKELQ